MHGHVHGVAGSLILVALVAVLWFASGELPPRALLFINLSPLSLDHSMFKTEHLPAVFEQANLDPSRVVFEITERSVTRIQIVVREARRLRSLGFCLALDDVGAGNAGLEMLRQVPIDFVKIDRSVISQALTDEGAMAVLSRIIAFARRARTFVIAVGIETQTMLDIVHQAGLPDPTTDGGVQGIQGYLLGRPAAEIQQERRAAGTVLAFESRVARSG